MKMIGCSEKRLNERYPTNIDKDIRPFNAVEFHRAKEMNHSSNGISFTLPVELKPGTVIQIVRTACPENCQKGRVCESCRQLSLATVKWCRENNGGGMRSYSVGAKYFEYGIGY